MNMLYPTNRCQGVEYDPENWKIRIHCAISPIRAKWTNVSGNLTYYF